MIKLKDLLLESQQAQSAEDYIKDIISGTEWENKIYAVGGYTRDQLKGSTQPKDLDLMCDAPNGGIKFAEWITKKVGNYKENSNPVSYPRFGTAKFNLNGVIHNGINLSGFDIESVMPRAEKYTDGSRKPEVNQTDLAGDALRRDATFNALFKNISTGEILDLTGKGKDDLKNGIIRTPLDPNIIFKEDALRILRFCRFYGKYGYSIPLYIVKAMKRNAHELKNISSERIQDELNKMLVTTRPDRALKLLKVAGILDVIIPEFKQAYKMTQNSHHCDTVFNHIIKVVKGTSPDLIARLSALFHDIGKIKTRTVINNDVKFYNHENIGADMTKEILSGLKYPTNIIDAVVAGVKNHMRLKQAGKYGEIATDKTLRKFATDLGDHLESTLDMMHSDNLAHAEASIMPHQIPNIIKRIDALKNTIPKKGEKLPITGDDLKALNIKPGPLYKELLDLVKDRQLEFPNTTKEEYLELIKKNLKDKSSL